MSRGRIPESMVPEGPDPVRDELQRQWHETREAWLADGSPDSAPSQKAHDFINDKLAAHLWEKTRAKIEEDRRKHPKARRNAVAVRREAVTDDPEFQPGRVTG